jgi:hypothetical protein
MSYIRVLFNNCFGHFQFSAAFEEEYSKRTGHPITDISHDSIRCDPDVLAIFDEKGSEWCSGEGASLDIRTIPSIFEKYWEIDEYAGNETVRICIGDAYADILHVYMEHGCKDIDLLRKQYSDITHAFQLSSTIKENISD